MIVYLNYYISKTKGGHSFSVLLLFRSFCFWLCMISVSFDIRKRTAYRKTFTNSSTMYYPAILKHIHQKVQQWSNGNL